MKHLLPDPEAEKDFSGVFTIYSCEFDNGKRANGNGSFIRLGEDGKIFLFLCQSCIEQLRGQVLGSLFVEVLRGDKRIPELVLESMRSRKMQNE